MLTIALALLHSVLNVNGVADTNNSNPELMIFPTIDHSQINLNSSYVCSYYNQSVIVLATDCTTQPPNYKLTETTYHKSIKDIGWNKLYNKNFNNHTYHEFYTMGYVEGLLSFEMIYEMNKGMTDMIGGKSAAIDQKMTEIKVLLDRILVQNDAEADIRSKTLKAWIYYLYGLTYGNNVSAKYDQYKFKVEDILFLNTNGEIHELQLSLSRYRFKIAKNSSNQRMKQQQRHRHININNNNNIKIEGKTDDNINKYQNDLNQDAAFKWNKWFQKQVQQYRQRFFQYQMPNYRFKQVQDSVDSDVTINTELIYDKYDYVSVLPESLKNTQELYERIDMDDIRESDPSLYDYIVQKEQHCSVVAKLSRDHTGAVKDVFLGHDTFDDFREMVRIWKYLDVSINNVNRKINYSSYGGMLYSTDDFYQLDNGIAITQTTIGPARSSIYSKYKHLESIPSFLRIMTANVVSNSLDDWIREIKHKSSHTNSAQWILIDYNLVNKSIQLNQNDLLAKSVVIFEQLGDSYLSIDVSRLLNKIGFFGSYNFQYFTRRLTYLTKYSSADNAEYVHLADRDISEYHSYSLNQRFNQMRYQQSKVVDLPSMMNLMRYNNSFIALEKDEPYGHPICALQSDFGCTDSKVVNNSLMKAMTVYAVSGPTWGPSLNIESYATNYFDDFMPKIWRFYWESLNKDSVCKGGSNRV